MTSARYPNRFFLTIDSSGVNTGLYDKHLLIHSDWSGAHLKVRTSDTKYEDVPVDTSSNGACDNLGYTYSKYHDMRGMVITLTIIFRSLDTAGEWYYDTSSQTLFIYTASAADTLNVEATVFNYGINAAATTIRLLRLMTLILKNQRKDGALFTGTSQNISFLNCNFRNCYLRAINLNVSSNDTIDHCSFNNIMGDCLVLGSFKQFCCQQ